MNLREKFYEISKMYAANFIKFSFKRFEISEKIEKMIFEISKKKPVWNV